MRSIADTLDVIIIGGGPAGLTAAIYLGRFRRRVLVLEEGHSRARWIPTSHNIPGFTTGVSGMELLDRLRKQAVSFGAVLRCAFVKKISKQEDLFTVYTDEEAVRSRFVLMATGVRDHFPDIPGASEAVLRSVLRFCPICDGFEAIDKRIAVIGNGPAGEREALFLTQYSSHVTLLELPSTDSPATPVSRAEGKFNRLPIALSDIEILDDRLTIYHDQSRHEFDVAYLALGCSPQHDLARSLSAECDAHGALTVNAHQETSVPGLYAAGDVVRGLNQVIVAAAESAIAATDIHNRLRAAI